MTKLEQLIQDLCPNGVKMVKLGDAFKRLKGTPITAGTMKQIADDAGDVTIVAGGKTIVKAFEKDIPNANIIRVPAVLVQSRGVIDFLYYDTPFTFKNEMWAYTTDSQISVKYLYYVLQNDVEHFRNAAKGMGSLPQISLPVTENFEIPLPPLAVQSEIVRLLDKFTLYKSELAAELAARCKQYEHYREKLFTFGDDVERKTLGEIGTFTRGRRFCRTDIVEDGQSCIHYGDIYTYYGLNAKTTKTHLPNDFPVKLRYAEKGDVVIVGAGENDMDIGVGVVWEGDDPVAVHDACYIFKHNINPRYVSHYLRTINYHLQIKKYVNRGKICSISAEGVAKAVIPIPSLEIQERIASILDRFDALCNDIKIGLPAEIELRQKQYEHYRDKLLTF